MSGTVYKILDINDFSDSDYNDCLSLMTEQRRQAVDRLRFTNDKIRTVAGEHTAKKMIAERYGVPPEIIPFDRTDRGKPFAVGIPVECRNSGGIQRQSQRSLCSLRRERQTCGSGHSGTSSCQ